MNHRDAILSAWENLDRLAHDLLTPIETADQHGAAMSFVGSVWEKVGEDAGSPYITLLQLLAERIQAYEEKVYPAPASSPGEMLAFLMDQNGLKQKDLAGVAPQSVISEVLSGKRGINIRMAKALGERFKVSPDLFL